jgi:hypothetical protein
MKTPSTKNKKTGPVRLGKTDFKEFVEIFSGEICEGIESGQFQEFLDQLNKAVSKKLKQDTEYNFEIHPISKPKS